MNIVQSGTITFVSVGTTRDPAHTTKRARPGGVRARYILSAHAIQHDAPGVGAAGGRGLDAHKEALMCAPALDSSSSGVRRQVIARLREMLDAANIPDHRLVSDDDLIKVLYTAWWITLVSGRNPDDQNELAATLRDMRLRAEGEAAA